MGIVTSQRHGTARSGPARLSLSKTRAAASRSPVEPVPPSSPGSRLPTRRLSDRVSATILASESGVDVVGQPSAGKAPVKLSIVAGGSPLPTPDSPRAPQFLTAMGTFSPEPHIFGMVSEYDPLSGAVSPADSTLALDSAGSNMESSLASEADRRALANAVMLAMAQQDAAGTGNRSRARTPRAKPRTSLPDVAGPSNEADLCDSTSRQGLPMDSSAATLSATATEFEPLGHRPQTSLRGRIAKRTGTPDLSGLPPPIITPRSSVRGLPGNPAVAALAAATSVEEETPMSGDSVTVTPQTMYSGSTSFQTISSGSGSASQPFVSARTGGPLSSPGAFQWPSPVEEEAPGSALNAVSPARGSFASAGNLVALPSPKPGEDQQLPSAGSIYAASPVNVTSPPLPHSATMSIFGGFGRLGKFKDRDRKSESSAELPPEKEKKSDSQGVLGKMFSSLNIMSGSRRVSPASPDTEKAPMSTLVPLAVAVTPAAPVVAVPSGQTSQSGLPVSQPSPLQPDQPPIPEMSIDTVATPVTPTFPTPERRSSTVSQESKTNGLDTSRLSASNVSHSQSPRNHQRIRSLRDYSMTIPARDAPFSRPPVADPRKVSRFPSATDIRPSRVGGRASPERRSLDRQGSVSPGPTLLGARRSLRGDLFDDRSPPKIHRAGTLPRLGAASLGAAGQISIDRLRSSASLGRRRPNLYVGSRPPSEVILDNLELYFPAINSDASLASPDESAEDVAATQPTEDMGHEKEVPAADSDSDAAVSIQSFSEDVPAVERIPQRIERSLAASLRNDMLPSRTPSPQAPYGVSFDPLGTIRSTSSIQSSDSFGDYHEIGEGSASLGQGADRYRARIRQAIETKHFLRESSVTLERRPTEKQKHVVNIMQQLSEFRRARREARSQDLAMASFARARDQRISIDSMASSRLALAGMRSGELGIPGGGEGQDVDPIFEPIKRDMWSRQLALDPDLEPTSVSSYGGVFNDTGLSELAPAPVSRQPSKESAKFMEESESIVHSTERIAREMAQSEPGTVTGPSLDALNEMGSIGDNLNPPSSFNSLERRHKAVAFQALPIDEESSPVMVSPPVFQVGVEDSTIVSEADLARQAEFHDSGGLAEVPGTLDFEDSEAGSADSVQMSPPFEASQHPVSRTGEQRDYFSSKPLTDVAAQVATPGLMTPGVASPAWVNANSGNLTAINRTASTRSLGMRSHVLSSISHAPSKFRWIKGELIGKGSFGSVYHGLNLDTGDFMAVKQVPLIHPKMVKDESTAIRQRQKFIDSLRNEIELLTGVQHDNVVRYLGFEVTSEHVNVFLEYVSGGSIASMLNEIGSFDESLVRSLVYQILCGLEYLHDHGIIHRDIKGANILLDEQGTAKITDFGISKRSEMAYRWNSRMSVQGSVYWMAPEVIRGKGYSAKVDIWSLGCLALEMLTGQHPWSQFQDQTAALYRLGQPDPRPHVPSYISADAQDFLNRCFIL